MSSPLSAIEHSQNTTYYRTTPWRHQREAVEFVKRLHARGKQGAMICAAMGTGKTAMAIYIACEQKFQRVLILCPLRVVQVWKPQFEMHSAERWAVISLDDSIGGVQAKRDEAERRTNLAEARGLPVAVVVNYESAWRSPFADWALAQDWDLIVADEIHRCKAPGGKASRFLTHSDILPGIGLVCRAHRCPTRRSTFTPITGFSILRFSAGASTSSASTTPSWAATRITKSLRSGIWMS